MTTSHNSNQPHDYYMQRALAIAEQAKATVSPNPMVGCVIVNDAGQIIGEGFHQRAGEPHAEILALCAAGPLAQQATAYVTLEPCCHYGRTPPCTTALIKAGIKKIYIACKDPNPLVAGKGITCLIDAGISVHVGLGETAAKQLNHIFFHHMTTQTPYVYAKWAMSLDGKTMTHAQDSRKISSPLAEQDAHELRSQVDAILIGANTARVDNPLLTIRYATQQQTDHASQLVQQPLRIVLTSKGDLPLDLNIFNPALPSKTLIVTTEQANPDWLAALTQQSVDTLILPADQLGHIDISLLMTRLYEMKIYRLLVEGGMHIHQAFFQHNLVNEVIAYLAPVIIGKQKIKLETAYSTHQHLGNNIKITARMREVE